MKTKLILTILTLCTFYKYAQCQEPADSVFPIKDGKIYYEKLIVVDSLTKDEIFKRVKFWAVNELHSQKRALETEDKEEGYIIYKTGYDVPFTNPSISSGKEFPGTWAINCILKFEIKDFKTRVTLFDFELPGAGVFRILNFKEDYENDVKKYPSLNKKYREKYYNAVRKTFIEANKQANNILESINKALINTNASAF